MISHGELFSQVPSAGPLKGSLIQKENFASVGGIFHKDMFRLVRANLPASNGAQQFRVISVWRAGVLMKGQGNMPIKTLPKNLGEDVREESLSEWVDPAVEEFSEHIVVRVELLQICHF
jgi:hypothetical protein